VKATTASLSPSSSKKQLSPTYKTLPKNAQKFRVRNVYDGDTLTLVDERRVRLLGIDTPEMKPPQPFSEEAKKYTKARCNKQEIWLLIDGEDSCSIDFEKFNEKLIEDRLLSDGEDS